MQQSDQLLLTSLRDFISIPQEIKTLSDIKGEEIFTIALNFLTALEIDVSDIKEIEKQKFRSTTKLNQKIHKQLQIELQLNDLLNPTTGFVRKTLLVFLSKLGSEGQGDKLNFGTGQQQSVQKRRNKKLLTNWIDDQWIHPSLIQDKRPCYSAYLFPLSINKKSIKSNLLPQLLQPSTRHNILSILTSSSNRNLMKQIQTQKNTGITKKKIQQNSANIETGKLIAANFQDWNMAEQKLNKIKRKNEKDKETAQTVKKQEEKQKLQQMEKARQQMAQKKQQIVLPVQSVFQAQVEQKIQEKEKQKQTKQQILLSSTATLESQEIKKIQNPLQKLRRQSQLKKVQYDQIIQKLIIQLNQKKDESFNLARKKQQLQSQVQKDEQKFVQYKTKTQQLKKEVEKKQLVLTAVQSPKEIEQEIKKFQEDIVQMEQQLQQQVKNTTESIDTIKVQSEKKLEALKDLKIKLNRIQTQYKQICEEIEDKVQRKGKIKINKSGISRVYYSKKISQIDKRWRDTQKQVQKIKRDLQIMKQKTNIVMNASDYLEKQIINLLQNDKSSKTEAQTRALKEIFNKCQTCFKNTLLTLSKINDVKEQTRQYEIKVHTLTSQNYKQGIQKINTALSQLKRQIQEMSKKTGK